MILEKQLQRMIEFIKYDYNNFKYPLVFCSEILVWTLILARKNNLAFKIASNVFRTGWRGSFNMGLRVSRFYFKGSNKNNRLIEDMIENVEVLDRTKKFFDDPLEMLGGIVIVLKTPKNNEKGVILLNYSYYFPLFLKFFDVNKISDKYNIILEPSWAGFCELSILAYSLLDNPVYLMCYEQRDKKFITELNVPLIPIDIGPSWFVDHNDFVPLENQKRDMDIIMVAGWARFKRHDNFFKCIHELKNKGRNIQVTLVGYPVDMTKEQIIELAKYHNVENLVHIYESITPKEVSILLARSKINILWSKFEGNNRAIIEGMFCDTPVILYDGHNYGEHYDFINNKTGHFSNERNLSEVITKIIDHQESYSPREYVMNNRNCILATEIMSKVIKERELSMGRIWSSDLSVKVNELHSMEYLERDSFEIFSDDYEALKVYLI